MLFSGIFWAYIIGSFVEAVSSCMGSVQREFDHRMNQANQMFSDFMTVDLPVAAHAKHHIKVSKRVRRFLSRQRESCTKEWLDESSQPTLIDRYPTLGILSPGLQTYCALQLLHPLIEKIPYLSLKYLTPEEQAEVALNSVNLTFSPGERFTHHPELGRGILIFRHGFGFSSRDIVHPLSAWRRCSPTSPIEVKEVGVVWYFAYV
jgi:hypothetical protein